ncbi:hypothetical protein D5086_022411 [Populus alba]|uniref:Uncharacterized protein n=1 Tax=Populus alba TaxID=43335 RepID=A0ACC4BGL7_POPAL
MLMAAKRSTGSAAMVQVAIGYEDNRESTYADMESNMSEKNYYLELLKPTQLQKDSHPSATNTCTSHSIPSHCTY